MVLLNLLWFNEKIVGVNLHKTKCIIALSVIYRRIKWWDFFFFFFFFLNKIKNILHSLPTIYI
jgi:hypothetical protein